MLSLIHSQTGYKGKGQQMNKLQEKATYKIVNSGWYRNDGIDQVFTNKKEAEQIAQALRSARARVWVEKVEAGE